MLPKYSSNLSRIIVAFGVAMLFIPKVNIVSFVGESAGIRIDDVLLFLLSCLLLIGMTYSRKLMINSIESVAFILFGFMILSNIVNIILFQRSSLLYSIRYFEYFIFFYIGQYYCDLHYSIIRLLLILLFFNGILMVLQILSIIGGFSSAGYVQDVASRVIGNSGGPWEIGTILNFLLAIFLFGNGKSSVSRLILLSVFTFFFVIMTGARMPLLAHAFVISYYFYKHSSNKVSFIRNIVLILGTLIFVTCFIPNPLIERSEYILSIENIDYFKNQYVITSVPVGKFSGFTDPYIPTENTDASWLIRAGHWIIAIKIWIHSYFALLVGVGPGTWGIALDGGWLRVLSEWGLFGFCLFIVLLSRISKISLGMFVVVVTLSINMLFIDVHIAYKAMSLFLFLTGYFYKKEQLIVSTVNYL